MTIAEYERQQIKFRLKNEREYTKKAVIALSKSIAPLVAVLDREDLGRLSKNIDSLFDKKPIFEFLLNLFVNVGAESARSFLNSNTIQKKAFFDWEKYLAEQFGTTAALKVTDIIGTTQTLAAKVIRNGLALANDGKGVPEIARTIRRDLKAAGGPISAARSRTIARTEVVGSSSFANHAAAESLGLDLEHAWITGGKNIRPSHVDAQNQGWKPMSEGWTVGGNLMMHPHDPNGGANEVINCKCVEIFRAKK